MFGEMQRRVSVYFFVAITSCRAPSLSLSLPLSLSLSLSRSLFGFQNKVPRARLCTWLCTRLCTRLRTRPHRLAIPRLRHFWHGRFALKCYIHRCDSELNHFEQCVSNLEILLRTQTTQSKTHSYTIASPKRRLNNCLVFVFFWPRLRRARGARAKNKSQDLEMIFLNP